MRRWPAAPGDTELKRVAPIHQGAPALRRSNYPEGADGSALPKPGAWATAVNTSASFHGQRQPKLPLVFSEISTSSEACWRGQSTSSAHARFHWLATWHPEPAWARHGRRRGPLAAASERLYDARGGFAAPSCRFLALGILLSLADPRRIGRPSAGLTAHPRPQPVAAGSK